MATENQEFLLHWHLYWTVTGIFFGGGGGGVNPISPPFTLAIYTHTTQSKRWTATENQDFQLHWHYYWTVTNFCSGGGGRYGKGGGIFHCPLPLTCWHKSYQELPWSICWATEYPNISPLFPLCVKGVFISKLKADTGWWRKHRKIKQIARVTVMGLILNPNILLSLKHPEHFERIRESISAEESIVPATMKLFFFGIRIKHKKLKREGEQNFSASVRLLVFINTSFLVFFNDGV